MKNCQRCTSVPADFFCSSCLPLNTFCSKCDSFVHNLPSKKNHKRDYLNLTETKITEAYSPCRERFESKTCCSTKICCERNIIPMERKFITNNKTFSKDYVNELKTIHEKEKEELIFKNNSLQNNLERLKISMNDQLRDLQKQIEESQQKNNYNARIREEESNCKLRSVIKEKDMEINGLLKKNEEIKILNEDLTQNLNMKIKQKKDTQTQFEKYLKDKDNMIEKLKIEHTNEKEKIKRNFSKNENEICDRYDLKLIEMEKNLERLENILQTRDEEINGIINKRAEDEKYYNLLINDLKSENEKLKQSLNKSKNESLMSTRESEHYKQSISNISTENRILLNQNEKLKSELLSRDDELNRFDSKISSMQLKVDELNFLNERLYKEKKIITDSYENIRNEYTIKLNNLSNIERKIYECSLHNSHLCQCMHK